MKYNVNKNVLVSEDLTTIVNLKEVVAIRRYNTSNTFLITLKNGVRLEYIIHNYTDIAPALVNHMQNSLNEF